MSGLRPMTAANGDEPRVMYTQRTGRMRVDGRGGIEHECVDGGSVRFWFSLPAGCLSGTVAQTLTLRTAE